ncbi:unnamed protein product, partial [Iphiclides podalirius]
MDCDVCGEKEPLPHARFTQRATRSRALCKQCKRSATNGATANYVNALSNVSHEIYNLTQWGERFSSGS